MADEKGVKKTIVKYGGRKVMKKDRDEYSPDMDPPPAENDFAALLKTAAQRSESGISKKEREKLNSQVLSVLNAMLASKGPISTDAIGWFDKLVSLGVSAAVEAKKKVQEKIILDEKERVRKEAAEAQKKANREKTAGRILENAQNEGMAAVGLGRRRQQQRGGR